MSYLYDEEFDQQLGAPPAAPQKRDPYDSFLDSVVGTKRAETQAAVKQAPPQDPKKAAEILKWAELTGLSPELLERNYDRAKADLTFTPEHAGALMTDAPGLASWLTRQDRVKVGAVRPELPQMISLEKSLRQGAGALGAGVADIGANFWGTVRGLAEGLDVPTRVDEMIRSVFKGTPFAAMPRGVGSFDPTPSTLSQVADFARASQYEGQGLADQIQGDVSKVGPLGQAVLGGIRSAGQVLPTLALGPEAVLGAMGVGTFGQAYGAGRDEGVGVYRSLAYAGGQTAIEIATEKLPVSWIFRDLKEGTPLIKTLLHQMASEIPGEQVATLLQDLNDWATLPSNQTKTFQDYLNERPSAAVATLISTVTTVGLMTSSAHIAMKTLEQGGKDLEKSETVKNLPEVAVEVLREATKGTPLEDVHVDLKTFTEFFQSKGIDPATMAAQITGDATAYADAIQTGEALKLPTAGVLVHIASKPEFSEFLKDVRRAPEAMTSREEESLAKELASVETAPEADATAPVARPIFDHAQAQFVEGGKVTPQVAQHYAALMEAAFTQLAAPLGMNPAALYQRYGLTVTREVAGRLGQARAHGLLPAEGVTSPVTATPPADQESRLQRLAAIAKNALRGARRLVGLQNPAAGATISADGSEGAPGAGTGSDVRGDRPQSVAAPGRGADAEGSGTDPQVEVRPDEALPAAFLDDFTGILAGARALGYTGTDAALAAQYADAIDYARGVIRDSAADDGTTARDLLKEISSLGGFGLSEEGETGYRGELTHLLENITKDTSRRSVIRRGKRAGQLMPRAVQQSGGLPGIPHLVVRNGGMTADDILTHINAEGSPWAGQFDSLSDFMEAVGQAIATETGMRDEPQSRGLTVRGTLSDLMDVKPDSAWWRDTAQDDVEDGDEDPAARDDMNATVAGATLRRTGNMMWKYLDGQKEAPDNGAERAQIREVFQGILERLQAGGYPDLTMSDLQALLWYPERRLYDMGTSVKDVASGYTDDEAPDYANAAVALAEAAGIDPGSIQSARARVTARISAAGAGRSASGSATGTSGQGQQDAVAPADSYQQVFRQTARASLRLSDDQITRTMVLFQDADLSSVLHESAHLFLDVFADIANELIQVENQTPEQTRQLSDFLELIRWTGFEGSLAEWRALDTNGKRPFHEKFAEAFESYLRDGKAPSPELRGAFARFRSWLLALAKHLRTTVQFSPDVRKVVDRMLATDAAIEQAANEANLAPMFLTPEAAGMTPDRFALYREAIVRASDKARETLETRLLEDVRREQTAEYRARKTEIRGQVAAEVYAEPVYQAISAMRKGTTPDGRSLIEGEDAVPMKLDRSRLIEVYGPDRVAQLPKGIATNDGGLLATEIADLFGYDSGDALLTALAQAEPMRQKIDRQTEARMLAEHGSMLLDGTLHEQARAAIVNDEAEQVVREELRALHRLQKATKPFVAAEAAAQQKERDYERRWFDAEAKLREAMIKGKAQAEIDAIRQEVSELKRKARGGAETIRGAEPSVGFFDALADTRLARTRVNELAPQKFWVAARQASKDATEAAARQELDRAVAAKQRELLNLALFRKSMELQDEVRTRAKFARDLAKTKKQAQLGLAGEVFQDGVNQVLARFSFAYMTKQQLASRMAYLEVFADRDLPTALQTPPTPYQSLMTEEFMGITDGLRQIVHLASQENQFIAASNKGTLTDKAAEGAASILKHTKSGPPQIENTRDDEKKRFWGGFLARHTKISEFAHELDGFVTGGWVWEHVVRPFNERQSWEDHRKAKEATAYLDLLKRFYTLSEIARFNEKTEVRGVGSLTKEARIVIARNWGNQDGRDRLLNDPVLKAHGWTPAHFQAVLDSLDGRDWQAVQATWDFLDSFWPEIEAKQFRVTGLKPKKVQAVSVDTRFGIFKGGYYPLAYDSSKAPSDQQKKLAEEATLRAKGGYVSTTTGRGHTKARMAHVQLPVLLEDVVGRHVDQVVHDLAFHETLIDVNRLIGHKDIQQAILATKGDKAYRQFTLTIEDIAVGYMNVEGEEHRIASFMKTGAQIAGMGYNAWTAAQQITGNSNTIALFGAGNYTRGLKSMLAHPDGFVKRMQWAVESSPLLKTRATNINQDTADLHRTLRKHGSWFEKMLLSATGDRLTQDMIANSFFWHIGMAQLSADFPAWFTGYEMAMADPANRGDEQRAFAIADQAVKDAQGTGSIHDLAAVQRGGPVMRLFLVFYSYGNLLFNQTRRITGRTDPRSATQIAKMLRDLSLVYIIPSLYTTALAVAIGKLKPDDWEEFFLEVAKNSVSTAMNTMAWVREGGAAISAGLFGDVGDVRGYEGPAGTRMFSLLTRAIVQVKQGEMDEAAIKAVANFVGTILHVPAVQIERSARGVAAMLEEQSANPTPLIFGPPKKEN